MPTAAPSSAAPAPAATVAVSRPAVDPATAAARAEEIRLASERLRLAREAEAAGIPVQDKIIADERPELEKAERDFAAAEATIAEKERAIIEISDAQITRYTSVRDAEEAADTAERVRDEAEDLLKIARGQLDVIQRYLQTTSPEFERTRAKLAEASRLFTDAETAHREAEESDKAELAKTLATKSDEFTAASTAHDTQVSTRTQLNDAERKKLAEVGTKESEHDALKQPAIDNRETATRLRGEFEAEEQGLEQVKRALETARIAKASAEALRTSTRETIERAEAEQRRLRKATTDAQNELNRLQALPPPRAPNPLDPAVQGDEDLAARYNLTPATMENLDKGDNFKREQMIAIVDKFRSELRREGAWKNNFAFKVADSGDRIEIWNTDDAGNKLTGPEASSIVIRPTLITFHGKVDDNSIQAALKVGDKLWGDKGICINSSSRSLKHGIIANAARLKELGEIKKYKASTFWSGDVGEGFDSAKEGVTAPRDTWMLGKNWFSKYNQAMDCLEHGIDSHHSTAAQKSAVRRPFFGGGPTTVAPPPMPAAS